MKWIISGIIILIQFALIVLWIGDMIKWYVALIFIWAILFSLMLCGLAILIFVYIISKDGVIDNENENIMD